MYLIRSYIIHSDICGPMNVKARHGASYFITFIDDFTRYGHVYLISHKYGALSCFMKYVNLVENQLNKTIKALRTDRGREYLSEYFKELCERKGIDRQLTVPLYSATEWSSRKKEHNFIRNG